MKLSKITSLYIFTILVFILSITLDEYEKWSALIPLAFISLSFFMTDKHPTGYRITHLIINIQIMLYYLFQLFLNFDLFIGESSFSFLEYSKIDTLQMPGYAHLFFILIYWLVYSPYYFYNKRKNIPSQL